MHHQKRHTDVQYWCNYSYKFSYTKDGRRRHQCFRPVFIMWWINLILDQHDHITRKPKQTIYLLSRDTEHVTKTNLSRQWNISLLEMNFLMKYCMNEVRCFTEKGKGISYKSSYYKTEEIIRSCFSSFIFLNCNW